MPAAAQGISIRNKADSLAVQRLRLCASSAGGVGLIPGWGTKIPYAAQHQKKKKERERINQEIRDEEKRMLLSIKSAL